MLNWRAISRLFDGWWPQRQASRLSRNCLSKTVALSVFFTSLLLFLYSIPLGWAAGNRHALSFQGLVKGLEAQMQRKYKSIHLSVPISPFLILLALSYLSVDQPSLLLKWFHFHLRLLDRHFRREVMSLSWAVRLDLSWPSTLAISYFSLCAPFSPSFSFAHSTLYKLDHFRT